MLKVPAEAVKNFDEEKAVNIISNTASFDNCQQAAFFNHSQTFNPIDKIVELYEKLVTSEKEKVELLQKV